MKKIVYSLFFVILFAGVACKKSASTLKTYVQLTRADIVNLENKLTTDDIILYSNQSQSQLIEPGSVIIYKTRTGEFGKLRYKSGVDDFYFDFVTFNSQGEIHVAKSNVMVSGSYTFNLMDGLQKSDFADCDFWAKIDEGLLLRSVGGAKFYVYSK